MAPGLEAVFDAFTAADARKAAAPAAFDRIAPEAPDDLVLSEGERHWIHGEVERDIECKLIMREGALIPRRIATTNYLHPPSYMMAGRCEGGSSVGSRKRRGPKRRRSEQHMPPAGSRMLTTASMPPGTRSRISPGAFARCRPGRSTALV